MTNMVRCPSRSEHSLLLGRGRAISDLIKDVMCLGSW